MFLKHDSSRNAIRNGIYGLLAGTNAGPKAPLGIISLPDRRFSGLIGHHTTLFVVLKGNGHIEASLFLLGDRVGMGFSSLISAPTAGRSMLRILLSTAPLNDWGAIMVDITREFLQSQSLALKDRYIAIHPPRIALAIAEWGGGIYPHMRKAVSVTSDYYGKTRCTDPKCAPARWLLTIAQIRRGDNFYQHRQDICVSTIRNLTTGKLTSMLCGEKYDIDSPRMLLQKLGTGGILPHQSVMSIVFCGISISLSKAGGIGFIQDEYRE